MARIERRPLASGPERLLADAGLAGDAAWQAPALGPIRDAHGLSTRSLALDGLR